MKYYVITIGRYSDYRILGIVSSKERAENIVGKQLSACDYPGYVECEIDNLDLVPADINLKLFRIVMNKNGNIEEIKQEVPFLEMSIYAQNNGISYVSRDEFECYIWGCDEKHTIKIANEKRIQLLLSEEFDI